MTNLLDAQIYVGTYGKYNNGSIEGRWMALSDYADREEFYEACKKLHSDEADPEFMFQDWENIPRSLVGESWVAESLFPLIAVMNTLDETEADAFMAYMDYKGVDSRDADPDQLLDDFRDAYQGEYDSEEEFAEQLVEECYNLEGPLATYFDYERFARDLFMTDYFYQDGYVFRDC